MTMSMSQQLSSLSPILSLTLFPACVLVTSSAPETVVAADPVLEFLMVGAWSSIIILCSLLWWRILDANASFVVFFFFLLIMHNCR